MRLALICITAGLMACATHYYPQPTYTHNNTQPESQLRPILKRYGSWVHVTTTAEFEKVLTTNPNVIVVFSADWCEPCKRVKKWWEDRHAVQGLTLVYWDVDHTTIGGDQLHIRTDFHIMYDKDHGIEDGAYPACYAVENFTLLADDRRRHSNLQDATTFGGQGYRGCTEPLREHVRTLPEYRGQLSPEEIERLTAEGWVVTHPLSEAAAATQSHSEPNMFEKAWAKTHPNSSLGRWVYPPLPPRTYMQDARYRDVIRTFYGSPPPPRPDCPKGHTMQGGKCHWKFRR